MSFDLRFQAGVGSCSLAIDFASQAQIIGICGPSGIGKTTLLNCIAGLVAPDKGRIAVDGRVLFDSEDAIDLPPNTRACGYVFQDARLFPHMNVERNLKFGQAANDRSFDRLVETLHLTGLLERMPRDLSGGETRRVAISRALLSNPQFLLLDEPLASLDPERGEAVLGLVERLRDDTDMPIVYVTHAPAEIERLGCEVLALA